MEEAVGLLLRNTSSLSNFLVDRAILLLYNDVSKTKINGIQVTNFLCIKNPVLKNVLSKLAEDKQDYI